jgi:hypothetical protein
MATHRQGSEREKEPDEICHRRPLSEVRWGDVDQNKVPEISAELIFPIQMMQGLTKMIQDVLASTIAIPETYFCRSTIICEACTKMTSRIAEFTPAQPTRS